MSGANNTCLNQLEVMARREDCHTWDMLSLEWAIHKIEWQAKYIAHLEAALRACQRPADVSPKVPVP